MKQDWINDPRRIWAYQTRIIQRLGSKAIREEIGDHDDKGDRWYRDGFDFMAAIRADGSNIPCYGQSTANMVEAIREVLPTL